MKRPTLASLVLGASLLAGGAAALGGVDDEPPLPPVTRRLQKMDTCGKVDVMFLFDTTASMEESIQQARAKAGGIIERLRDIYRDIKFAVASVEDHPIREYGSSVNVPYRLVLDFSYEPQRVLFSLDMLTCKGGQDDPEAYAYALRSASNERGWRQDARRFIVLFADSKDRNEARLREAIRTNNADVLGVVENPKYWQNKLRLVAPLHNEDIGETVIDLIASGCSLVAYR